MRKFKMLAAALSVVALTGVTGLAHAITVNFDSTECPSCQNVTQVVGNEWSSFGLTVSQAYWYTDSRDTFDQMGLSVFIDPATITLTTASNGITYDYWVITGQGQYDAYDSSNTLLDSFVVDASNGNVLGTRTVNGLVSSLVFRGAPGYTQVSTLTFTQGNVPEPSSLLLLGSGFAAFAAWRRRSA